MNPHGVCGPTLLPVNGGDFARWTESNRRAGRAAAVLNTSRAHKGPLRRPVAAESGCPVTVYANTVGAEPSRCGLPCAPDALFCVGHEADRRRLGGAA